MPQLHATTDVGPQQWLRYQVAADHPGPDRRQVRRRPSGRADDLVQQVRVREQHAHAVALDRGQDRGSVDGGGHGDGAAGEQRRQDGQTQSARTGERGRSHAHVRCAQAQRRQHLGRVPPDVALGHQHPLRRAGRARRVGEQHDVVGFDLTHRQRRAVVPETGRLQLRHAGVGMRLGVRADQQPRRGVLQDRADLVLGSGGMDRRPDRPEGGGREHADQRRRMVPAVIGDAVAGEDPRAASSAASARIRPASAPYVTAPLATSIATAPGARRARRSIQDPSPGAVIG